jgi:hypothetical protein
MGSSGNLRAQRARDVRVEDALDEHCPVADALSDSGTTTTAAHLTLVKGPYEDALVLTDFGVSVPDDASILGIQFDIRLNADAGLATDVSVRILRNGAPVGEDRSRGAAWPTALSYTAYGGAGDLWATSWTPSDVRSSGFGIAVTPRYTGTSAGNDRAHVDSAGVTVYFTQPCD